MRRSGRECLGPFHKTDICVHVVFLTNTYSAANIYIHPARFTCQLLPGSGADRNVPIRDAEIVGGQGNIQRACQRGGNEYHESAGLYDKYRGYDDSLYLRKAEHPGTVWVS